MKNLCGKCNVCCTECRIDKSELPWRDTDKVKGETCEKLIFGSCGIYKKRPKPCRTFECMWLQVSKLTNGKMAPEKWRPDNLGIFIKVMDEKNGKFLFHTEEIEKGKIDFNNPEVLSFFDMIFNLIKQQKKDAVVVLYYFGENKGHQLKQN